jgi:hypothetical protein
LASFAAGWVVGGVVMIGWFTWRMLKDMDEPWRRWTDHGGWWQ